VLQPPAVRLRFKGAGYKSARDNSRVTYEATLPFELLCYEENLRSPADQRKATLVLVSALQDQLAGARLTLQDGAKTQPITMVAVDLVATDDGPVDQLFAVSIEVNGFAQFGGPNA
jgi:hypothetical protein